MADYNKPSRCSSDVELSFRWFGYPPCAPGEDIDRALERLFSAISGEGRVWNPYAEGMVRSEFRKRLEKACIGKLKPVDEVKSVDRKNPPPLYEIRWSGIAVTDRDEFGERSFHQVEVRMYHSEPIALPGVFIGHHTHEKLTNVPDVNGEQQTEIETAAGFYYAGESINWGIAMPQQSHID